jgi:hypothetical protein
MLPCHRVLQKALRKALYIARDVSIRTRSNPAEPSALCLPALCLPAISSISTPTLLIRAAAEARPARLA